MRLTVLLMIICLTGCYSNLKQVNFGSAGSCDYGAKPAKVRLFMSCYFN